MMKGHILNIVLALVLVALPVAANAGWSETQQVIDQGLPAPTMVEQTEVDDGDFNSSPVMFIENVGQWDEDARFQVWGSPAGTMWLAEDAIWITVMEPVEGDGDDAFTPDPRTAFPPENAEDMTPRRGVNIKLSFIGGNPHPRIETFDRLDTKVSYFYGNDPDLWRPDVPVWGGVNYTNLYPGVDLRLKNDAGEIVPLLVTAPNADLSAVQLRVEGAYTVSSNADMLRVGTSVGKINFPLLRIFGANASDFTASQVITGEFEIDAPFNQLTDSLQPEVQDSESPNDNPGDLILSTFLGGGETDTGNDIAVDDIGSSFVTGYTYSSDFPTTPGVFDPTLNGSYRDAFVTKVNPTGVGLVYSTFLGGSDEDFVRAIAIDMVGNAYVTGRTESHDFPITPGAFDPNHDDAVDDAFVTKLNSTGTELSYSTYLGGGDGDGGAALAVDEAGSAYITGGTFSNDFPTTHGAFDRSYNGNYDAFVAKLNPAGSDLIYATFLGGTGEDGYFPRNGIAVDEAGSAYVASWTGSSDFPTTSGAFDQSYNGDYYDAFVTKLDSEGGHLIYSTFLGGGGEDVGNAIAVDEAGSAYVTGWTDSSDFPTTLNSLDQSYNGDWDAFVVKLNPFGSALTYGTYLGDHDWDLAYSIAVDEANNAYLTGATGSPHFPTTPNAFDSSRNGSNTYAGDAFLVRLNSTGSALDYGTFLGGYGADLGDAITVERTGCALVAGWTDSLDFPTSSNAFDTSYNGGDYDAFVTKLGLGGSCYDNAAQPTDPTNSMMQAQPASVPADGSTFASIYIQLRDSEGQPVRWKTVRLSSSRGALDQITQPATVTNAFGEATGAVRSATPGSAEITATVMDDGVVISNPAIVTFEPYSPASGELLFRLDHMVDRGIDGLERLGTDAQAIAEDGTYFRGAIGADSAKLAADVVFNLADLVVDVNQTAQLSKAARLACPGCYVPGTWNVRFAENYPAVSRLLDLGFLNLETAPAEKIAEFIGWGGPKFYGKLLNSAATYVTKEVAKEATRNVFVWIDDGMTSVAYPAVHDTGDQLALLLQTQEAYVLANLPAMSPTSQNSYIDDITGRSLALINLASQLSDEKMTLENLRHVHDQSPNPIVNFLLRFAAKGLAKAAFDGPGTIAVGGTLTLFDGYMDGKALSESMHMYDMATGALLGAPDAMRQTYQVAYRGLDRIARGLPADRARGQINSVVHYHQGSGWGPFWSETASWSEVSLTNTGQSEASYLVKANYLADTTRFGVPWGTMNLVEESSITLAPGATGTVRIDYKRANGTKGFSPRSGLCIVGAGCVPPSDIDIQVLANNEAGTYFADHDLSTWTPVAANAEGGELRVVEEAVIDPPLTAYVVSAPWTQQHEALLWVNNPFTSSVTSTIAQVLPPGISVLDPGGATQNGNTLTWNTVVEPSALGVVTFTFSFPATPGTSNTLPPADLSMPNPLGGQILTYQANSADFAAVWPATVDYATPGYVLPGVNSNTVVTVTNWLDDIPLAGSVTIDVTDAMSATVHSTSQPFNLAASSSSALTFVLPGTLAPGNYMIHGTINAAGATAPIFADTLQVGIPGPGIGYQVDPMGPVHPNDLLTYTAHFTNTVGAILSNAVLTASIPVSTTVVPGSVTGGGIVEPGQVRWQLGTVPVNQVMTQSFAVTVNDDAAPPEVEPGHLLSEPRLTAEQIAPTWGPAAWNLVTNCGSLQGDVNCDCTVDVMDLSTLSTSWQATIADPLYVPLYDIVPDERIDIADIQTGAANWLEVCQ